MTCVVQITGGKDVGKTALAERVIRRLKEGGYTVVAIKVSHHDLSRLPKTHAASGRPAQTGSCFTTERSTCFTPAPSHAAT